jgi:hypothetical protein
MNRLAAQGDAAWGGYGVASWRRNGEAGRVLAPARLDQRVKK